MILDSMLYKPSFEYLKKEPFSGSYKGMRYKLYKETEEKEEGEKEVRLVAAVYPEPFCFEKTPDDKKEFFVFPFSPEGLEDALSKISSVQEEKYSK